MIAEFIDFQLKKTKKIVLWFMKSFINHNFLIPWFSGDSFQNGTSLSLVFLRENSTICAYLAYYNDVPVATAIGHYGSGVIGLYGIATLEKLRRRGIGIVITLTLLYEAMDLGYEVTVLHSTEMGLNLYKQICFKEYIQIERFIWNF